MIPKNTLKISLRLGSRGRAASHQPSSSRKRGEAFCPTVAANAIEDNIDAALAGQIPHLLGEIGVAEIDPMFGAERFGLG